MKTLIVHSSGDSREVDKWVKKRSGLGEFYRLSFVGTHEELMADPERKLFIQVQIAKAKKIYGVEKVLWLEW